MDNVKERLLQYAKTQKIGMMNFYKKSSISQSNFSGDGACSALSTDKIIHILIIFPDINPDWLLLGKGEMLRGSIPEATSNATINRLLERLEDLARENGQLQAENAELKKELAQFKAVQAASARTA